MRHARSSGAHGSPTTHCSSRHTGGAPDKWPATVDEHCPSDLLPPRVLPGWQQNKTSRDYRNSTERGYDTTKLESGPLSVPPHFRNGYPPTWWRLLVLAGHVNEACACSPSIAIDHTRALHQVGTRSGAACVLNTGAHTEQPTCSMALFMIATTAMATPAAASRPRPCARHRTVPHHTTPHDTPASDRQCECVCLHNSFGFRDQLKAAARGQMERQALFGAGPCVHSNICSRLSRLLVRERRACQVL